MSLSNAQKLTMGVAAAAIAINIPMLYYRLLGSGDKIDEKTILRKKEDAIRLAQATEKLAEESRHMVEVLDKELKDEENDLNCDDLEIFKPNANSTLISSPILSQQQGIETISNDPKSSGVGRPVILNAQVNRNFENKLIGLQNRQTRPDRCALQRQGILPEMQGRCRLTRDPNNNRLRLEKDNQNIQFPGSFPQQYPQPPMNGNYAPQPGYPGFPPPPAPYPGYPPQQPMYSNYQQPSPYPYQPPPTPNGGPLPRIYIDDAIYGKREYVLNESGRSSQDYTNPMQQNAPFDGQQKRINFDNDFDIDSGGAVYLNKTGNFNEEHLNSVFILNDRGKLIETIEFTDKEYEEAVANALQKIP